MKSIKKKRSKSILLYLGDAKDNKGFNALPSLIEEMIKEIVDDEVNFILQYTITNDNKILIDTDNKIKALSISDNRIKVMPYFLSDLDMHDLWMRAEYIVFNYDCEVYRNQSSGVLWLAAAYRVNAYFMTDSWLNREAERLGMNYSYGKNAKEITNKIKEDIEQSSCVTSLVSSLKCSEYREQLLSDFGRWLVREI
ncbi:hypothetical protein HJ057_16660 [Vibrio parahaemolyticus]|nr:hypothetical protein [Vibrio parahaemolyticus]